MFLKKLIPIILLSVLTSLFVFQPISLTSSDLGRHITNGKEIVNGNFDVLYKNVYSYTHPEEKFANHHWLTGVLFYLIENTAGFKILHLIYSLLFFLAISLLYLNMNKTGSWETATLLTIPAGLLFASRQEIRPEIFGYIFISIFISKLYEISTTKELSKKTIIMLAIIESFWINLHISFIFGIILVGILLILEYFQIKHVTLLIKKLFLLISVLIFATLLNPNGLKGIFQPFSIFENYGYSVLENQTLYFLRNYNVSPATNLYFLFSLLTLITLTFLIKLKITKQLNKYLLSLSFIGIFLGFIALRNLPIFTLLVFPYLAQSITLLIKYFKNKIKIDNKAPIFLINYIFLYIFIFILIISGNYQSNINLSSLKIGVNKSQFEAIEFFNNLNITGNIFNNYDNGGFLIYNLYPNHQVFVDNRPEAYTIDFFQNIYIPMQEDEKIWKQQLAEHDFQAIFFRYHDYTPWGQSFLQKRIADPKWKIAYQDNWSIIFIPTN